MCGLGVILRTDGGPIPEAWLDALDTRIAPRGPDGHGRFCDRASPGSAPGAAAGSAAGRPPAEVAMVHRRLSIIDHAGGGQPMVSGHGLERGEDLLAVVFNGCLYNHRALRRELEAQGRRFRSDHSDTEVLLHGHRAWGAGLPDHLEGMYAYALWDRAAARLILARDRFGEKPLYMLRHEGVAGDITAASSDARALADLHALIDPSAALAPDPAWTAGYLQLGYGWGGATGFRWPGSAGAAVVAVPPGLQGRPDRPAASPPPPAAAGSAAFARGIEQGLERAVLRRLDADVPLGCFLSGGVDSSLVACFARRHRADLRTFSVRMPDPRYDESHHAERVAAHLGTRHRTLEVAAAPAEDTVALVRRLGQPFADSSILPTYWVSRAARRHVTVALAGDGADELFYGYRRYVAAAALHRLRPLLRRLPARLGAGAHPRSALHTLGRLGVMAREYPAAGVLAMESIFTRPQVRRLLGRSAPAPLCVPAGADAAEALRGFDLGSYLPGDLLTKVDGASMSVALEVRCPYLDRELSAAALAAPRGVLMPRRQRKGLLRRIARRHLPAEIVDRPKMGFAVPIGEWFRTDHGGMKTLLRDRLLTAEPFGPLELDPAAVRSMVEAHWAGRCDHGQRLFALLTLAIWGQGL